MDDPKDKELLERAQSGPTGFAELFDAYYDRVYAYAYRRVHDCNVAEDISALTFEQAWRGIKRVRWRGKPVIAWLFRIASRRVADHYRHMQKQQTVDWEWLTESHISNDFETLSDRQQAVAAAVEALAERHREIVKLIYFDDLEPVEVAAILGCNPNNVYVRLHRALKALKSELHRSDWNDPLGQ